MKISFIATGDSFITRHVPRDGYPGFDPLRELITEHDVGFNNLETTFHDQEGYPAASSGGTWAMTEPSMLDDIQRYGFNLYNTANNHSGDFGVGGVMATIRHLKARSMVFAGTGDSLHSASRPVYLETPEGRVALIGITDSFDPAIAAGGDNGAVRPRPGLNPLRHQKIFHVSAEHYAMVEALANTTLINWPIEHKIAFGYAPPFPEGRMPFGKLLFERDEKSFIETTPHRVDLERTLKGIEEAKRQADVVLISLHTHEMQGKNIEESATFTETFARACIDAGASVVLGHGPHLVRGIERYRSGLIFYSLGNFIFQTETIAQLPYDALAEFGYPLDTTPGIYMDQRSRNGTIGFPVMKEIWQAIAASWVMEDGVLKTVRLYPLDLGMNAPRSRRGTPTLTTDTDVLERLQRLSAPYHTSIRIEKGVGIVEL